MLLTVLINGIAPADAEQAESLVFDPQTGLRVGRYRSPTPDSVPGGEKISLARLRALIDQESVVLIDVMSATGLGPDPIDGTWRLSRSREHIPQSIWLPEVGRGILDDTMLAYFESQLARITKGDVAQGLVFYCVADCWMSWNATQRAAQLGYENVYWYAEGTDGWVELDLPLVTATPIPVDIE